MKNSILSHCQKTQKSFPSNRKECKNHCVNLCFFQSQGLISNFRSFTCLSSYILFPLLLSFPISFTFISCFLLSQVPYLFQLYQPWLGVAETKPTFLLLILLQNHFLYSFYLNFGIEFFDQCPNVLTIAAFTQPLQ